MEVVLLIVVLVILVVVHEFGHFLAAKASGMRVDEFGIGYPPRVAGFKYGETEYTLNALPFGGFVKIYGEDLEAESRIKNKDSKAFTSKNRLLQAVVLVAGIAMNLLLAFVLLTAILATGTPRALDAGEVAKAHDAKLAVAQVLPGSPAAEAGLMEGDYLLSTSYAGTDFTGVVPEDFTAFVTGDASGAPLTLNVLRGAKTFELTAVPRRGVITSEPERIALGLGVATVGTVPLPLLAAVEQGASLTWELVKETAAGLTHLFVGIFTLSADLSQVSGPVGIAGAVGTASAQGVSSLISLMAIISINLALINLLPVPALDGGRLLFVIIEAITRRPIPARFASTVNSVGFALLVLLMVLVTGHDVYKLIV